MGNAHDILIRYKKIETNEIHYEDIKDFQNSLYKNVYREAFKQVENILNCNSSDDEKAESGNLYRKKKQINNIISFIGGRGTGKTSAMLSFMEALKDYYYFDDSNIFYKFGIKENSYSKVSFVGIEHIDASLLESSEDLFEVIISMMYSKLQSLESNHFLENEVFDYQKKDVLKKFEKVYEGIYNLKRRRNGEYTRNEFESYVSSMNSLSDSMGLKEQFQKLVQTYLNIIRFRKSANLPTSEWIVHPKPYLVITIDDIDINTESGYEMLEQIHRYLMVKQVIVLLAVDEVQMRKVCEGHFWGIYKNSLKEDSIKGWEKHIHNLAGEYLEKVLPTYRRVYMPQLQDLKKTLKIGIFQKEKSQEEIQKSSVKNHILQQIALKSLVCFDALGLKQHFYEPETIRGVINLCQFLIQLEDLSITMDDFINVYEKNYAQISADIYVRMVNEELVDTLLDEFSSIRKCEISRRGAFAHELIQNILKKDYLPKYSFYLENMKRYPYSYGELLLSLYLVGRCNPEYKPLVRCILASFSLTFNRQYILFTKSNISDERNMAKECLRFYLGHSISGSRTNDMIPKVRCERYFSDNVGAAHIGAVLEVSMKYVLKYELPEEWKNIDKKEDLLNKLNEDGIDFKWIQELEMLLMLFSDFRDESRNKSKISLEISEVQPDLPDGLSMDPNLVKMGKNTRTVGMTGLADFNILGFVNSLFLWDEYFDSVDSAITVMIVKRICDGSSQEDLEILERKIKKQIDSSSLRNVIEYKEWYSKYKGFAIPFYNIDMTYNVLKRISRAYRNAGIQVVEETEIVQFIYEMYERIEKELTNEEKIYKGLDDDLIPNVKEAYHNNPYIVEFKKHYEDKKCGFKERFQKMLLQIARQQNAFEVFSHNEGISVDDQLGTY